MTTTYALNFLDTDLRVNVGAGVDLQPVIEFFSSHFTFSKSESGCHQATLNLFLGEAYPVSALGDGEKVWIRQSASKFFSVPAERLRYDGDECVRSLETGTTLRFRRSRTEVDVGLREPCPLLDLIELIRDLVLKFAQESGKVAIHATSCLRDGEATVIVGAKGAGKSSLAIELVRKFGFTFLSGDKTFLWSQGGDLMCAGWPDWPHIGLGTASNYPELVEAFGLAEQIARADTSTLWATANKLALDPTRFRRLVPPAPCGLIAKVARLIYPRVEPAPGTDLSELADGYAGLAAHIEWAFRPAGDWHEMVAPTVDAQKSLEKTLAAARQVPAFKLRGIGRLTDEHGKQLGFNGPVETASH